MATRRPRKTPPLARQAAELAVRGSPGHRASPHPGWRSPARRRRRAIARSFGAWATEKAAGVRGSPGTPWPGRRSRRTQPWPVPSWVRSGRRPAPRHPPRPPPVRSAAALAAIVRAGLAPVHRRAVANAKRLSRTTLSERANPATRLTGTGRENVQTQDGIGSSGAPPPWPDYLQRPVGACWMPSCLASQIPNTPFAP